jgi:MFS family permease
MRARGVTALFRPVWQWSSSRMSQSLDVKPVPTAGLDRTPILLLLAASTISSLGNQITNLAVLWFVLDSTGSATRTGLVGFFTMLPIVLALFFGGALVDRFGHRRMSIIADMASAVTVALIPTLHHSVGLPLWALLALVFLGAILDTPGNTARRSMIPELASRAGMPIERATSLFESSHGTVSLLGPVLAGLLVAAIGTTSALFIDAATFIISALIISRWLPSARMVRETGGRYLDEVREGLRFLFGSRLLLTITVAAAIANFFAAPIGGVLLPVFAHDQGWSARALGFIFAGFGGGTVIGALLFGWIGMRFKRRTLFILFFAGIGVPIMLFAFVGSIPVGILFAFLTGLPLGGIGPLLGAVNLERIPEALRGRVLGATGAISMCAAPLGMLVAGPVTQWIGTDTAFIICGSIFVLIGGWFVTQPVLHEMERLETARIASGDG